MSGGPFTAKNCVVMSKKSSRLQTLDYPGAFIPADGFNGHYFPVRIATGAARPFPGSGVQQGVIY